MSNILHRCLNNFYSNDLSKNDYIYYEQYMAHLEGPLNDEKVNFINAENKRIGDAKNLLSVSNEQLFNNEISLDSYEKNINKAKLILTRENAFKKVYKDYDYIYEDPTNRYFIKNNDMLSENMNIVLYFTLLFAMIPLFFVEFESGVFDLIKSSTNHKKIYREKVAIAFVVTIVSVVLFQFADLFIYASKTGTKSLLYPLSSMIIFENTRYSISILSGFLLITLFRIIGSLGFVFMLALISNNTKYKSFIYYIAISFLFLGEILIKNKVLIYYIPTPFSLMRGVGFLMGNVSRDIGFGKTYEFSEVPFIFLTIAILVSFAFVFLAINDMSRKYKNYISFKNGGKRKTLFMFIIIAFLLSGCGKNYDNLNEQISNISLQHTFAQNSSDLFYIENNTIYRYNKKNGKISSLRTDPFLEDEKYIIDKIYVTDENLLYSLTLQITTDLSSPSINEIREIDLQSGVENTILNRQMNLNNIFLGLIYYDDFKFLNLDRPRIVNLFKFKNNVYMYGDSCLFKNNYLKREKRLYDKLDITPIAIKGNILYFLDKDDRIGLYNLDNNKFSVYSKKPIENFIVTPKGILYSSFDGIGLLKSSDVDINISKEKAEKLSYDDKFVYFIKKNSTDLYVMDYSGNNLKKLKGNTTSFEVSNNSNSILCYTLLKNGSYGVQIIKK